jgi:hypothetical protein
MENEEIMRHFVRQTLMEEISNIFEIGAPVPMGESLPTIDDFKEEHPEHTLSEKNILDDKNVSGVDKVFQKTNDKLK